MKTDGLLDSPQEILQHSESKVYLVTILIILYARNQAPA